jgi:hypothetical protein
MDERDFLFNQNEENSDSSSSDGSNYEGSSSSSSSSKFDMMDIDDTTDEAMQMAVSLLWDLEGGLEDSTIKWRQRHEGLLICEISEDERRYCPLLLQDASQTRAVRYALAEAPPIPTRCWKSKPRCF